MTQTISIRDARNNLANIVNQVAIAGHSYIITKFGQPKALVTKVNSHKDSLNQVLDETFGIWKHRKDIKNTVAFSRKIRYQMSTRFHGLNISS